MWSLCKSAYEQYQCEIINGNKLYHRFANGLLYSNQLIDSTKLQNWECHVNNLLTLQELLTDRKDLVERYFLKPSFDVADFEQMMFEFDTCEPNTRSIPSALGYFTDAQLMKITQFVNDNHKKERLFYKIVTFEEIKALFSCSLKQPLRAGNNAKLAYFLYMFRDQGLLAYNWQTLIEQHHLLSSSKEAKPLTRHAISSHLSAFRQRQGIGEAWCMSLFQDLAKLKPKATK